MTDDWQSWLHHASQLREAGRVSEAIVAYQKLLAINPDLPDSWYNLGRLLKQDRQFDAALDAYDRALALNVAGAEEVHLNRAVIYSDHLRRPDDAERELRGVLDKSPAYVPALLNLGNLREDLGDRAGAQQMYRRALAAQGDNPLALARLAAVSHASQLDESLAARLRDAIRTAQSPAEKADLGFALAGLLDAAGQYGDAFEAARQANAASRAAGAARYDRAAHERFVERLIRTFTEPATGQADSPTLFICGMFRSGSTLVEQILGAHSQVTAGGELDLIPALAAQIPNYPEAVATADESAIEGWREFYLRGLPTRPHGLLTDKRPDIFLHLGLIKTIFPGAKIIHTRRNPLDNLLSLYFLHLDPSMAYALDLEDAAHWYGQYARLMAHWKTLYPNDIFDVDYDELVREPRPLVERLLGFFGLEWEDRVLDFHRSRSAVKTASVWQVRETLHTRSSGRARHYEKQLRAAREFLEEHGLGDF